ncbi:hypothetical protein DFQ28_000883 [Apophysomyces sp. BC1034]|nr:hypothetical protein DFQ30_001322 [Apophysomyces sp. BC1015]KAG0167099.1 hypothetical protein DFQ29_000639 [Apophysomyces sp. BC1021]KAG0183806.1 hypothetical protein DFQ28_000883 [Apophysomyces sp. BC1034]
MTTPDRSQKRSHSSLEECDESSSKRACTGTSDLLTELTQVLAEIKSTPSTGEISAELLGTLRLLMLQIERLSADESNTEARHMKDESERFLGSWFDDLVARCEADGELDLDALDLQLDDSDDEYDDDALAIALALQDEEDHYDQPRVATGDEATEEKQEKVEDNNTVQVAT